MSPVALKVQIDRKLLEQAIAMLYRLWIEGDQVHGLRAVAAITTQKGESNGL